MPKPLPNEKRARQTRFRSAARHPGGLRRPRSGSRYDTHLTQSLFTSQNISDCELLIACTMTTDTVKSPPTSPPPKRVMTDEMGSAASGVAKVVPSIDQAPPLLIKKISEKARLPTRGSAFAAGYDLYASKKTVVPARGKVLVDTDLSMAVPAGTCKAMANCGISYRSANERRIPDGRIAPRSGLASKHFIDTGAGVIDADYRGPVKVLLFNHNEQDFSVEEGDRIAQLVLERIYTPEVLEVQELEMSVRGAGGFGSTGTN
jgi:dUTP pyrophosphatase